MHYKTKTFSLWKNFKHKPFDKLQRSESTQVCIVGSGISGLSIAYQLLKAGKQVIVLDKELGLSGETALTTAHISNALDDGYANLENIHGKTGSFLAANSHTEAIKIIEKIIQDEQIECDFSYLDGYLITGKNHDTNFLKKERNACFDAGLKEVHLVDKIENLKFLGPALDFPHQAQFHSLKYLLGLQEAVIRMGGKIYGNCFVSHINEQENDLITVELKNNKKITCEQVVVATNAPSHHRMAVHTKEAAYRSYVVGIKIPSNSFPKILLWDTEDPYHYVRIHQEPDFDVLIIGGEDHRVGQNPSEENMFENLISWTKRRLGYTGELLYKWSGQIIETVDGLAYIGKSPEYGDNVFEVSGDSGHGITHGTIASIIIRDLILGKENVWSHLYSPERKSLGSLDTFLKENMAGSIQMLDWITGGDVNNESEIAPGEGAIMREGINKVAVYRDERGHSHKCSAVCPHLGAIVHWNSTEKTWDCPFHGSRFSPAGKVINGPAQEGLKSLDKKDKKREP